MVRAALRPRERIVSTSAGLLSAVVPAYNEAESLPELHRELVAALDRLGRPWEILYVDDGSRDGTDRVIAASRGRRSARRAGCRCAATSASRRRSPPASALARGEWVATMDADLQDDPAELPRLIAALEGGLDLVSGWKQHRQDPIDQDRCRRGSSTR